MLLLTPAAAEPCGQPRSALGVARVVDIDASGGPLFGDFTKYEREPSFLGPKEVVLTFDDGPMPWITKSILDTLDRFCTKATFFSVGRMALAYPAFSKEVLARGHTLGTHTWSHPMNLRHLNLEKAKDQIERGFAAVALAAGAPIAPFFRFPGLSDSGPLLAYLQERGVAAFTVDVVSNDSYIGDADRLAQQTLARIEARQGGIILFHDIKASTAKALPAILSELKKRGYQVIHMRARSNFTPLEPLVAELTPILAKAPTGTKPTLMPFYGSVGPTKVDGDGDPEVTEIAPARRSRPQADQTGSTSSRTAASSRHHRLAHPQAASDASWDLWPFQETVQPKRKTHRKAPAH